MIFRKLSEVKFRLAISNSIVSTIRRVHTPQYLLDTPYLNGDSATYLEDLYVDWQSNPSSVDPSWNSYFQQLSTVADPRLIPSGKTAGAHQAPPIFERLKKKELEPPVKLTISPEHEKFKQSNLQVKHMVEKYLKYAHVIANTNPLEPTNAVDLEMPKFIKDQVTIEKGTSENYLMPDSTTFGDGHLTPLVDSIKFLNKTYCGTLSLEAAHVEPPLVRKWIYKQFETKSSPSFDDRKKCLIEVMKASVLQKFLEKNFPNSVLHGLPECYALLPAMQHLIDEAATHRARRFNVGMAHRGRLSFLGNILANDLASIMSLLNEGLVAKSPIDCLFNYGLLSQHVTPEKKHFEVALYPNPSSLEVTYPVLLGRTKGEQDLFEDNLGNVIWPVIIHTDAALSGMGVAYETINISKLKHFHTGGVIHMVINNQIGETTTSNMYKSSRHAADIAKGQQVPVLHVNAMDLDAVLQASKLAVHYRKRFHLDIVINLIGFQRYKGPGTVDPNVSNPKMYKKISSLPTLFDTYTKTLLDEKILDRGTLDGLTARYMETVQKSYEQSLTRKTFSRSPWMYCHTDMIGFCDYGADSPKEYYKALSIREQAAETGIPSTGVEREKLLKIADRVSSVPPGMKLYQTLMRTVRNRKDMIEKDRWDWSMGEAAAIGSTLMDGYSVRLTGEDVERGTFTQRHLVFTDINSNKQHSVLSDLSSDQGEFTIVNSALSEFGMCCFEYGYSTASVGLTIWEGQFGDFVNGSQACIDEYLACGEEKWMMLSSFILLLPHGMEGQGPEHSSARPERYLMLCNDQETGYEPNMLTQLKEINMIVINCTLPGNFFHALRRQMFLPIPKPLIALTPKSLLRHTKARSSINEMLPGTHFRPYIPDPVVKPSPNVKRLVLCTGKVYYDILEVRDAAKLTDVAVARLEQIAPFPYTDIEKDLNNFPNAKVVWCQEEHKNQGCYVYVRPRIRTLLYKIARDLNLPEVRRVTYAGRAPSPSTAVGNPQLYVKEKDKFLNEVLNK